MSKPGGPNFAALESMRQQSSDSAADAASTNSQSGGNASAGHGSGIDGGIGAGGKMVPGLGDARLDFGTGGESIEFAITKSNEGVFTRNPLNDTFDGQLTTPCNVNAFQGMGEYQGIGNVTLSDGATMGSGLNVGSQISAVHNPSRGGGQMV